MMRWLALIGIVSLVAVCVQPLSVAVADNDEETAATTVSSAPSAVAGESLLESDRDFRQCLSPLRESFELVERTLVAEAGPLIAAAVFGRVRGGNVSPCWQAQPRDADSVYHSALQHSWLQQMEQSELAELAAAGTHEITTGVRKRPAPPMPRGLGSDRGRLRFVAYSARVSLRNIAATLSRHDDPRNLHRSGSAARWMVRAALGDVIHGITLAVDTTRAASIWGVANRTLASLHQWLATATNDTNEEGMATLDTCWRRRGSPAAEFDTFHERLLLWSMISLPSTSDHSAADVRRVVDLVRHSLMEPSCGAALTLGGRLGRVGAHFELQSAGTFYSQRPANGRFWAAIRPEISCSQYHRLCNGGDFASHNAVQWTGSLQACPLVCNGHVLLQSAQAAALRRESRTPSAEWTHYDVSTATKTSNSTSVSSSPSPATLLLNVTSTSFPSLLRRALGEGEELLSMGHREAAAVLALLVHRWGRRPSVSSVWWMVILHHELVGRYSLVLTDRVDWYTPDAARLVYLPWRVWLETESQHREWVQRDLAQDLLVA